MLLEERDLRTVFLRQRVWAARSGRVLPQPPAAGSGAGPHVQGLSLVGKALRTLCRGSAGQRGAASVRRGGTVLSSHFPLWLPCSPISYSPSTFFALPESSDIFCCCKCEASTILSDVSPSFVQLSYSACTMPSVGTDSTVGTKMPKSVAFTRSGLSSFSQLSCKWSL